MSSSLLFLLLLIGMGYLYPWTHPHDVAHNQVLQHKRPYLNMPFFIIRTSVYFAHLDVLGLSRSTEWRTGRMQTAIRRLKVDAGSSALRAAVHCTFTATFAYIDWILSADPAVLLDGVRRDAPDRRCSANFRADHRGDDPDLEEDRFGGRINPVILHDLGNMMFAFTIFWTYLFAVAVDHHLARQSAAGNWLVPGARPRRLDGVASLVALVMFAIPFLALLSQERKRDPIRLIRVAIWILLRARGRYVLGRRADLAHQGLRDLLDRFRRLPWHRRNLGLCVISDICGGGRCCRCTIRA